MLPNFPKISVNCVLRRKLPVFRWLPEYGLARGVSDFIAGLTVGLTLLPQAIAYAALAGLGPQYGLYSSFAGSFVYIFFGTVKEISIGPTALLSLLTFTYTSEVNPDFAVLLCFLSGVIEVLCGIFRLGFIVEFVSIPVISGFCSATAVIIASSQVKGLLGVSIKSETFLETWSEIWRKIPETRPWDLTLSAACCAVLLGMRKLKDVEVCAKTQPRAAKVLRQALWMVSTARNAIVVVACAGLAYSLARRGDPPFLLTGAIESGLPEVGLPPFATAVGNRTYGFLDMCSHLGRGIVVVPVVSLLGNMAVAKAFANGEVIDATQEMTALGLCNIVGSLFRSMPVSGSFSRSAVGNASGVQSPLAGLHVGILILLALSFLTPYFFFIPKATLSSVIICAVIFMVEVRLVRLMWKSSKQDLIPAFLTFIICLWKGVEIGILSGVAVDFMYLLYINARPKFKIDKISGPCGQEYMIIYPSIGLLFPAVDCIRVKISKICKKSGLPIVLDCNHIKYLDFTAIQGLKAAVDDMKKCDCLLLFYRLDDKIAQHLKSYIGNDFHHCPSEVALPQFMKGVLETKTNARSISDLESSMELEELKEDNS